MNLRTTESSVIRTQGTDCSHRDYNEQGCMEIQSYVCSKFCVSASVPIYTHVSYIYPSVYILYNEIMNFRESGSYA